MKELEYDTDPDSTANVAMDFLLYDKQREEYEKQLLQGESKHFYPGTFYDFIVQQKNWEEKW